MTYPATRYLQYMTSADGWHGQLVRDRHGQPVAIVGDTFSLVRRTVGA